MNTAIAALILAIAVEMGLPPYFVLSIALTENPALDPLAVSPVNSDGSVDRGIMQLSSSWYSGAWDCPETNIRAACQLITELSGKGLSWWEVAIAYNCGYGRFIAGGPPDKSLDYAAVVMTRWEELERERIRNKVFLYFEKRSKGFWS